MQALGYLALGLLFGWLAGFQFGTRKVAVWAVGMEQMRAELEMMKRVNAIIPSVYDYTAQAMREKRANFCPVER